MEQAKEALKRALKFAMKIPFKIILVILILVVGVLLILLPAATYFLTVDDGTYKEDDWSSTPYAASTYVNGAKIENDGTITTSTTAQNLWDKMLENGNRVDLYLKNPAELSRIMKAEMVTQYPDTRSNPDEEINWDKIFEDPDAFQGIIKFKRADSDNNKTTMVYASPEEFQAWIDEYNSSGDETAKKNALTHFTLKKAGSSTTGTGGGMIAAGDGVMTDVSQAIVNATNTTPWPGKSLCSKWVDDVYDNAGVTAQRFASAYDQYKSLAISTDRTAIPVGAAVYGTGTGTAGGAYGHVGIYIGGGKVADSVTSGIQVSTLEEWIGWQENAARNGNNVLADINGNLQHGWLGWGWADGNRVRGTTQDPNLQGSGSNNEADKEEQDEIEEDVSKRGTETNVAGDGYSIEYTSSAGITYKLYRQFEGSYANNNYWNGTMHNSGCGPTAIAILASGLTGYNYTPADIATQMGGESAITSFDTLKAEMDSLGLSAEIIQGPSAQAIKDQLLNGKVMLVSVNNNTIFTSGSHIMTILDINESGQVYIGNPGSSSLYGWYNIDEIMKGCQYIITTDAKAAGIANTENDTGYVAVVATWKQTDTSVTSNDSTVEQKSTTEYSMTTTDINYEEMVDPYTMPFDMLWSLLVVGEDKKFIFELTDLIYNSDIEITVHDNLTVNTDIDEWHYTQKTKAIVDAKITAKCNDFTVTGEIENDVHDPHSEEDYITTKKVVTQTNTVTTALTRANVWIVDYKNEYTYVAPTTTTATSVSTVNDQAYPDSPSSTGNSYSCEHIEAKRQELEEEAEKKSEQYTPDQGTSATTHHATSTVDATVKYYSKYVNIYDNITNIVESQKYIAGTPDMKEKTDKKSEEPNFVTIFNKGKYKNNKSRIKDASTWLFEIIESNDSISDMLDLIKYLLYMATGIDYGVTEFDFSIFYPGEMITVGEGDYIVDTTKSPSNIVITDLNKLKQAFSGYSNDRVLQQYAYYFLQCQEKYHVNAVFAAAVSITESSAGTNLAIGGNNIFSISNGGAGNWNSYGTMEGSIEAFFKLISGEYFGNGQYLVSSIANGNPPGSHMYCIPPEGWIKNTVTYMTQMFNAAGINPTSSATATANGNKIVEAARSKLGCAYVYGAAGPNQFDCSGLTQWCYKQVGISIPHNTEAQRDAAKKKVPVSEAQVGDILYKNGHVGIYIGNGQFIHAPHTGDVVKISNVNGYGFKWALQFN